MGKALPARGETSKRSESKLRSKTHQQIPGRTNTFGGNWK
jgi:hypothetical protein